MPAGRLRLLAAGVSIFTLSVLGAARAENDTAVPPVDVTAQKTIIPIGEPVDAEGHKDHVVTRSRTGSKDETRRFYALFLKVDLTEAQIDTILGSRPTP